MVGSRSVFITCKEEGKGPGSLSGTGSSEGRCIACKSSTTTRGTCSLSWGGIDVGLKPEGQHSPLPVSVEIQT